MPYRAPDTLDWNAEKIIINLLSYYNGSRMLKNLHDSISFAIAAAITAIAGLPVLLSIIAGNVRADGERQTQRRVPGVLTGKREAMAFYGLFSHVYDLVNKRFYSDAMRNEAVKLADVAQGSVVLDAGCGTGYTTKAILDGLSSGEVIGVDLTAQQIGRASEKLRFEKSKLSLLLCDVENLPFRKNVFDAAVSVGAIEYFPDPKEAIREMARVTKANCKVVVGGPELHWFRNLFLDRVFYTPSIEELKGFFADASLRQVKGVLTGVDTLFGTNRYVVLVEGVR